MSISLNNKLKELTSHGFVYGITSSFQNILGFLLLPLLTSYYNTEEFGVYSIILLLSAVSSAFFYFGASSALGRFYFEKNNVSYKKKLISSSFIITISGGVILMIVSILFANNISQIIFETNVYANHIKIALISSSISFIYNLMTLILRYEKKSKLFMFITLTSVIINFLITYSLLTIYNFGILAPLYGTLFSVLISSFIIYFKIKKYILLNVLDKEIIRKLFVFGINISFSSVVFFLVDYIDRLIIKDILTMSDVGIYSLGYRIGFIINIILVTPFSLIYAPLRMEYSKHENSDIFMKKTSSYFGIIGYTIVLFFMLYGNDLLSYFIQNNSFIGAAKVFPIIMLSILIYGFQNILDYGVYLNNKTYYFWIISLIGLALNIIINYSILPVYGFIGAAYSTLITYFVTTLLFYLVSRLHYKFELELKKLLIPLLALFILYYYMNFYANINSINYVFKTTIFVLWFILITIFWLDKKEKVLVISLLKK